MTRLTIMAALIIGIAGCAATGPEEPVQVVDNAAKAAAIDKDATSSGEIEYTEAPQVERTAMVAATRDEMICRFERRTGSHRVEKICRPKSQIEGDMREAQRVVRDMEMRTSNSGVSKN